MQLSEFPFSRFSYYFGNASNFLVVVGDHNQAVVEGTENTMSVEKLYIHPSYEADTNNNDLAILKLNTDIPFGRTKKPICLYSKQIPDGTLCVVTGWGDTRGQSASFGNRPNFYLIYTGLNLLEATV